MVMPAPAQGEVKQYKVIAPRESLLLWLQVKDWGSGALWATDCKGKPQFSSRSKGTLKGARELSSGWLKWIFNCWQLLQEGKPVHQHY